MHAADDAALAERARALEELRGAIRRHLGEETAGHPGRGRVARRIVGTGAGQPFDLVAGEAHRTGLTFVGRFRRHVFLPITDETPASTPACASSRTSAGASAGAITRRAHS
jgi:hypothetical protein